MKKDELPLGGEQPARKGEYRIEHLTHGQTRVSQKNPRFGCVITDESVAPLAAEIRALGQAHDAIGEPGPDGVVEILAGSRRREVMRILDRPLRVRLLEGLTNEQALKIANREDRGALAISLWDKSGFYARMLSEGLVTSEARLADAVGEDKSAINRALALQKAPAAILDLVADKHAISMTQWSLVAPLLEDDQQRALVLERADVLAGQKLGIAALVRKLTAAAAGKEEIKAIEVLNAHGKIVATITPDHRGAFSIRVKSMTGQHKSHRTNHARMIHAAFLEALKTWFPDD